MTTPIPQLSLLLPLKALLGEINTVNGSGLLDFEY